MEDEEILDLVNASNKCVGTIKKTDSYNLAKTKLGFIRGAAVFIQNEAGELWIPTRQMNLRVSPGGLDFSMAEHVSAGETTRQACVRGFKEELFMDIAGADLELLGTLPPSNEIYWFCDVFLYKANSVKDYSKDDFSSAEWIASEELIRRIENDVLVKRSILPALKAFF